MLSLVLLLFPLFLSRTLCSISSSDLSGSYILQSGSSICSAKLTILSTPIQISASSLLFTSPSCLPKDRTPCRGGRINLVPDMVVGTAPQLYFGNLLSETGTFLSGPISAPLSCGCGMVMRESSVILFVKPDSTIENVVWDEVFVGNSIIGENSRGGSFDFREGVKYILVGSTCFYRELENAEAPECFSADALAETENGGLKRMDQMKVGDRVVVGKGGVSEIFGWTHWAMKWAWFVRVEVEDGGVLKATRGHLVYLHGGGIVKMRKVEVGMILEGQGGQGIKVVKVGWEGGWGIYNPHTVNGDIVVGGVRCSCYTSVVGIGRAHALLVPLRAAWRGGNWVSSHWKD